MQPAERIEKEPIEVLNRPEGVEKFDRSASCQVLSKDNAPDQWKNFESFDEALPHIKAEMGPREQEGEHIVYLETIHGLEARIMCFSGDVANLPILLIVNG